MFRDFQKPKREREPLPTLTWHRCSHPKGMTHCKALEYVSGKPVSEGGNGIVLAVRGCAIGAEVRA